MYFLPLPQGQGSFLCGFMSVAFPREKGLIRRAPLPPERHRRRLNSTDVLYSLVKIRPLLGEVLSFEAYRVNFFFAEIKKLRALDVVKLQMTISLDAYAIHGIASAMSVDMLGPPS